MTGGAGHAAEGSGRGHCQGAAPVAPGGEAMCKQQWGKEDKTELLKNLLPKKRRVKKLP